MARHTRLHRTLILLGLAWGVTTGGCGEQPAPVEPVQLDAVYRLLFNDVLVGNALFALSIDAEGTYRLEAFTTPAGQMAAQGGHEILEVSEGRLDGTQIRPASFEHSVMQEGEFTRVRLLFDWSAKTLRVDDGDIKQTLGLLPQTHDRLSYLLAASRLITMDRDAIHAIRLASLEATEEAVLQVIGQASVSVPLGSYAATGIRRVTMEKSDQRELWFADAVGPLPLRVLRRADGNTIEMQLVSLTKRSTQPLPE